MLIWWECSSTFSNVLSPGWLKWLKGWITDLTYRNAFFVLFNLLLRASLVWIRCYLLNLWVQKNLFCLQGKHLIPVASRIHRSAKGRQSWLTLDRPGAGVKLLGLCEVSCPASSRALGNRLHAEVEVNGGIVSFRNGMQLKYSNLLRPSFLPLAFLTWLRASGITPCSQSRPTAGRLSAILQHGTWAKMITGTGIAMTPSCTAS